MNQEIRTILARINSTFYMQFAGDFARTRQSWPPGFKAILPYLAPSFNVLDLGCGNARLLRFLHEQGWRGSYLGVDGSAALLQIARQTADALEGASAAFAAVDLLEPGWAAEFSGSWPTSGPAAVNAGVGGGAAVACLAVLHHIPGRAQRVGFLTEMASLLPAGGQAVISTWQFVAAPRLRHLMLPWSEAGLSEDDVEPGDYLLGWGAGGAGRRYCALIDEAELRSLASAAGLEIAAAFYADGKEGNLNLYASLKRAG